MPDYYKDKAKKLAKQLGEKKLQLLLETIVALYKISQKKGYNWDLHGGNVMMRGNAPVIVDPWVTGEEYW